jgi:alanine racemase
MNNTASSGVRVFINQTALQENYAHMQRAFPNSQHGIVVKANGYGMGAERIAACLVQVGCRNFYVARPQEASELRKNLSHTSKIYVFHGHELKAFSLYHAQNFIPILHSLEILEAYIRFAKNIKTRLPAAIKINTGMNRLGLDPKDLDRINWQEVKKCLQIDSIHSHLACGRNEKHPLNPKQYDVFIQLCERYFQGIPKGLSASCQLSLPSSFALDLTRQGLNLFGAYSPDHLKINPLRFALKVQAKILQIRHLEKGASVGYDAQFIAYKQTKIAVISMGYADGLPLSLSNKKTPLKIGGIDAPLIGQVSMDLATLDVTHVPEKILEQNCWVDVFYDNMSLYKLANEAQSSMHDIILGLGPRCERIFI